MAARAAPDPQVAPLKPRAAPRPRIADDPPANWPQALEIPDPIPHDWTNSHPWGRLASTWITKPSEHAEVAEYLVKKAAILQLPTTTTTPWLLNPASL